jgi:hypothetical protein
MDRPWSTRKQEFLPRLRRYTGQIIGLPYWCLASNRKAMKEIAHNRKQESVAA